jgi:hypothetical protein
MVIWRRFCRLRDDSVFLGHAPGKRGHGAALDIAKGMNIVKWYGVKADGSLIFRLPTAAGLVWDRPDSSLKRPSRAFHPDPLKSGAIAADEVSRRSSTICET